MPSILLVDAHSVFRSGLRHLLERRVTDCSVVEISNFEAWTASGTLDLVLADITSLEDRDLRALKELQELLPSTRCAVMSNSNKRTDAFHCLSRGYHGYFFKLQSADALIAAVEDLLSGRLYLPNWLVGENDAALPPIDGRLKKPSLTPRQRDILPLLVQGMSNKEIARRLNIALGTTQIHMTALLRALGARNRTEGAFEAARLFKGSSLAFCASGRDEGLTASSTCMNLARNKRPADAGLLSDPT